MFNEEHFLEIGLHVVELPPVYENELLYYSLYLQELPTLTGSGFSKKEAYQNLTDAYLVYRKEHSQDESEEEKLDEEKTQVLTMEELLHYYDGETFDGFKIETDDKEES